VGQEEDKAVPESIWQNDTRQPIELFNLIVEELKSVSVELLGPRGLRTDVLPGYPNSIYVNIYPSDERSERTLRDIDHAASTTRIEVPPGAIGQVRLSLISVSDKNSSEKPGILVEETVPSYGYRALQHLDEKLWKSFYDWNYRMDWVTIRAAQRVRIADVYAKPRRLITLQFHEIGHGNAMRFYMKPYRVLFEKEDVKFRDYSTAWEDVERDRLSDIQSFGKAKFIRGGEVELWHLDVSSLGDGVDKVERLGDGVEPGKPQFTLETKGGVTHITAVLDPALSAWRGPVVKPGQSLVRGETEFKLAYIDMPSRTAVFHYFFGGVQAPDFSVELGQPMLIQGEDPVSFVISEIIVRGIGKDARHQIQLISNPPDAFTIAGEPSYGEQTAHRVEVIRMAIPEAIAPPSTETAPKKEIVGPEDRSSQMRPRERSQAPMDRSKEVQPKPSEGSEGHPLMIIEGFILELEGDIRYHLRHIDRNSRIATFSIMEGDEEVKRIEIPEGGREVMDEERNINIAVSNVMFDPFQRRGGEIQLAANIVVESSLHRPLFSKFSGDKMAIMMPAIPFESYVKGLTHTQKYLQWTAFDSDFDLFVDRVDRIEGKVWVTQRFKKGDDKPMEIQLGEVIILDGEKDIIGQLIGFQGYLMEDGYWNTAARFVFRAPRDVKITWGDERKKQSPVMGDGMMTVQNQQEIINSELTGNARFARRIRDPQWHVGQLHDWLKDPSATQEWDDILIHGVESANRFAALLKDLVRRDPALAEELGMGSILSRLHLILVLNRDEQGELDPIFSTLDVTALYADSILSYDIRNIEGMVERVLEDRRRQAAEGEIARAGVVINHWVGDSDAIALYGGRRALETIGVTVNITHELDDIRRHKEYDYHNIPAIFFAYDRSRRAA